MAARTAQEIWIDDKARRAGHADGAAFAQAHGLKNYRLQQLYRAATKELLAEVGEVSVLPKELRAALAAEKFAFDAVEPVVIQNSNDQQTIKGLFRLHDGNEVEAVLMQHFGERNTVCISSQSGCAYACAFCSTGQAGFTRHLTPTEIFDQARYFARHLAAQGRKITNIVFMGMGEPFHNYDSVMDAVRLLNDAHGFGLGHRHITISTVGVVPQI
jgi:23S rRNA (adenine2503-C2)-methyltransferase